MTENVSNQAEEAIDPLVATGEMTVEPKIAQVSELDGKENPEAESGNKDAEPSDQQTEDEGAEYWKAKYEEIHSQHEELAQFSGIIGRMQNDDGMVDVLERYMNGELVGPADPGIYEEEDLENAQGGGDALGSKKPAVTPEEAEEAGRKRGLKEAEMQRQVEQLMEDGVPDHMVHEFLDWVKNPTGLNLRRMLPIFNDIKAEGTKASEGAPEVAENPGPKAGTVASMPGTTDRPAGDRYVDTGAGDQNFVSNPNNL